jgi:hypothetical protein
MCRSGRAAPVVVAETRADVLVSVVVAARPRVVSASVGRTVASTGQPLKGCPRRCRLVVARDRVRARLLAIVVRAARVARVRSAIVLRAVLVDRVRSAIVVRLVLAARARRLAIVVPAARVAPVVRVRQCVRVARPRWAPPSVSSAMRRSSAAKRACVSSFKVCSTPLAALRSRQRFTTSGLPT